MNFNTKSLDHKFYGKTIGTFTELEGKLFELDILITMGFLTLTSENQNEKLKKNIDELGRIRFLICCEILGFSEEMIEIVSIENIVKRIDESEYGYGRYLIDHQENTKLISNEDMGMVEKLFKKKDVIGQMIENFQQQPSYMMN